MKAVELFELTDNELKDKLADSKTELFNLRFQLATGQLENPMKIREVKKDIARIQTVLRSNEIKAAKTN